MYIKPILCSLLAFIMLTANAQIVSKNKKAPEAFQLTINNQPYEPFIKAYAMKHASYKKWQATAKAACKDAAKGTEQTAKIKILVSVDHDGKVYISNHYSSPSLDGWIDDPALTDLVNRIAKDLHSLVKKKGKVKPAFNTSNGQFYNDEAVVELVWEYKCS